MKIVLNPEVHLDVLEIMEYYAESASIFLASDFYSEFSNSLDQIARRPTSFPLSADNYRRANLSRFPHNILFRIVDEKTIRVLVVRHNRRHPSYGTERN